MAGNSQNVSDELVVLAATRARMAAHLAGDDVELSNGAFTAGLLSVIDVVFHCSMHELVADLPLPQPVRRALLDGTGPVGNLLAAVYAFERADTAALERLRPPRSRSPHRSGPRTRSAPSSSGSNAAAARRPRTPTRSSASSRSRSAATSR